MIKKIINPEQTDWKNLCKRPELFRTDLEETVRQVFLEIKRNGDCALKKYTEFFDGVSIENLNVTEQEIDSSEKFISKDLKQAIQLAKNTIEKFHHSQFEEKKIIETSPGVNCWRESRPIEKVGIYIPGGSAPLFSTVLMLGIPAVLAGCKEIILCSPPNKNGKINPIILYTAKLIGIHSIFCVGGIQAIGAMALGTGTIGTVNKIFGPGNQYVVAAKQLALQYHVAIDVPAGPSEVLVIADKTSNPEFVAADLLSQAEHGADSQVILLCDHEQTIDAIIKIMKEQVKSLPRKEIILKSLENSSAILLRNKKTCMAFSNLYAPEHLIIASEQADDYVDFITAAGSVFLGNYSCESAGDYASGTNHTLPTNGYAHSYSGVSLDSFLKKITFQKVSAKGIQTIGPAIQVMADAEQLQAHKNAVTLRLKSLRDV